MRRRPSRELLDSDLGTPHEIETALVDLRWFNRWFGGVSTSRKLIEVVAEETGKREISWLEVAAGGGFLPLEVAKRLQPSGISLEVTLLDRSPSHLRNGTALKVAADALRLPFQASAFDVVASSLFVHHLGPDEVIRFAQEALRVCRSAVLVNDLVRHRLHWALASTGRPLYRSRLTRHDAPASVRQAYTTEEMRAFFVEARANRVELYRHYLFRMGVLAWKGQ
jgi:ubiquinone/menaquinone biosynthesis C-methylase UbiE